MAASTLCGGGRFVVLGLLWLLVGSCAPEGIVVAEHLDPPTAPGAMAPELAAVDALAVWLDTRDGTAEIRAARLGADGELSEPVRLARLADLPG